MASLVVILWTLIASKTMTTQKKGSEGPVSGHRSKRV